MTKQEKTTKIKVEFAISKTIDWSDIIKYSTQTSERNSPSKSNFWCGIVTEYKTNKIKKYNYVSASACKGEYLIDFSKVNLNDVIRIREDEKRSCTYTNRYEINAVVSKIDAYGVELTICASLYKAIQEQKRIKSLPVTPAITAIMNYQNHFCLRPDLLNFNPQYKF